MREVSNNDIGVGLEGVIAAVNSAGLMKIAVHAKHFVLDTLGRGMLVGLAWAAGARVIAPAAIAPAAKTSFAVA